MLKGPLLPALSLAIYLVSLGCAHLTEEPPAPIPATAYGARPWTQAHCVFYPHNGWRVASCDDDYVGRVCRERATVADDGTPVNYYPRACQNSTAPWNRDRFQVDESNLSGGKAKPSILIGRSFMSCVDHEIAHIENPGRPAWVAEHYPCREDVK